MGCDIHTVVQVKKSDKWLTVEYHVDNYDRNYDSFAVLADVRNGYGFAGVSTGRGWPFIDEPRGAPIDYVFDNKKNNEHFSRRGVADGYELGDHSFSWLLLSEIESFIETRLQNFIYTRHGVVDMSEFKKIQSGEIKRAGSWCGGVSGSGVKIISEEDAKSGADGTHVQMSWPVAATDCLYTLKKIVEDLREIAKKEDVAHDNIRLVFGFDS